MKKRVTLLTANLIGFAVLFFGGLENFAQGQWTEPVLMRPPINVNPGGNYYYSTISADGQILCMTIDSPSGFGDDDVYISERIDDSTWTTPLNAGPNVNNEQRNLSPSITSDRQRLYYVKWTGASYDFFVSYRTGPGWDDWTVGEALPENVNRRQEFTGQISFDDSTLVFTSDGRPGPLFGGEVMCTSRLQPDSTWSEPIIIAPHLNQINGSFHPCLTDSGQTLVYGMFGGPSIQDDIFYAFKNDTGFGNAIRCDTTINTAYWDSSPSCPVNGSYLIFDSRRNWPNGAGAAQLFIARRMGTPVTPRPHLNPPETMNVVPSWGTTGTVFEIELPASMAGSEIKIYNIGGQLIQNLLADRRDQTSYLWKGSNHGKAELSSGVYFVAVYSNQQQLVSRIFLVH